MPPPIAPWTARPLLLEAAQASRWIYAPRFGRQMRVDVLDDDASARETTQFHHGVCDGRDSLDLHLVIPKALCVATTSEGQPRMPGSAVLGCFDHFSTYAISEADTRYRPGVSVSLQASFAQGHEKLLQPGRTMVMRCTVPKSGAAMSFASAEVTVDGEPVAQLAHIKYMPLRGVLGVVWDTVFSSMGIKLAEAWNGYALLADRKLLTPGNVEDDLASLLELRDVRSDSTEQGGLTADFGPIRLEQTNPLGDLHGGCQAMLSEKLGVQAAHMKNSQSSSTSSASHLSLQSIRMAYYRGGRGDINPTVTARPRAWEDCVVDTTVRGKHGAILSEGTFTWQ
eukprot:m.154627 g.154627  ORF g.154627 m.154627 type:complete len:339 (+) comp23522_c0_seq1:909-1925(+)